MCINRDNRKGPNESKEREVTHSREVLVLLLNVYIRASRSRSYDLSSFAVMTTRFWLYEVNLDLTKVSVYECWFFPLWELWVYKLFFFLVVLMIEYSFFMFKVYQESSGPLKERICYKVLTVFRTLYEPHNSGRGKMSISLSGTRRVETLFGR